jgi:hypothetical protein
MTQKRQRFVADQRFDLPNYNQMMDFISDEFHNYNRAFISESNKIVSGWKIVDAGGLTARVDNAAFSLLINSERVDKHNINYRDPSLPLLEVTLADNATNFVEVELFTGTTGNQSVAIWDQTANSGEGEEFIQNVDTAQCEDARLVTNTVAFTVGNPARIPLASVTTASGSITLITDARDFMYHLDTDFDFDGTAFGVTRTDKVIKTFKEDSDAIKTIIKEMKGLTNWYDPESTTSLDLLERMNYILTDGGVIHWDLPKGATGSLIAHLSDPVTGVADGDTFVISDGVTPITFEFDMNGSSPPNAVAVPLQGSSAQVKTAIVNAINAAAFNITATPGDGNRIELSNSTIGLAGNILITESLSNDSSLNPLGMDGGFATTELRWTGALNIVAPSRAFSYTIDAQTISVADGEVAYVTLPDVGVVPGGSLAVSTTASSSYLLDAANTRNYIIAYRSGTKIYFGNGWQNVELEDGESNQLGDGITEEWVVATGLVDETDDTPPYTSNHFVSPDASFTQAISELDDIMESLFNLVTGVQYDEYVTLGAPTVAGSKITLPPPFGVGVDQTYQTGFRQLEVFFNGAKVNEVDDYIEVANVGAGIGDEIELVYDLPANVKIQFRIQTGGGQDGTVSVDAPDVFDEGALAVSTVARLNFVGPGVRIEEPTIGIADVIVQYPREIGKLCKNGTGSAIPIGKAVAWLDDGTITLADANVSSVADIVGVTAEEIAPGVFGTVIKAGNVAGALLGLGATPGNKVYLSGIPGDLTLTPPAGLTDTIIFMGRAEPPDGVATPIANDLSLMPEIISEP